MTTLKYLQLTKYEKAWGVCIRGDKNNGEFKSWNINGNLYEHCFYKNNELHGEYRCWHKNENLNMHCLFENGKVIKDYLN